MHILYVNGAYEGGGPAGDLIHDFTCSDPDLMKVKMMADAARRVKESTEGVKEMCKSMELLREESLARGREEGRQEGREEGRQEGRQEGRILQLIEVYRTELHLDDAMIREKVAKRFGLPESEVSRFMQEPVELS